MDSNSAKLVAFMNSFSQGKSGSDAVFIEVAKRIPDYNKIIVTSLLGKELCQKSGLKGEYFITTTESEFRHVIRTYLKRTVRALFLKMEVLEKDILLGTSDFLPDVLPIFWLKAKNRRVKWIQHIFHLIPAKRLTPFLAQKLSFLLIKRRADLVITDNRLLKEELAKFGFDPAKIVVRHPGINLGYLEAVGSENASGYYEGVFMGQIRPSKGIFDLPQIWKLICQEKPEARMGIIGKGKEGITRKLKKEIERVGMERNIDLLGYLENGRAFATIKASKVFIFPSHEEGFGIAPLEAQALGLPVVAWNLPVFAEVFPKGMVKVEMGDIRKFAAEILNLLTNPSVHDRLSGEAASNANRFDWDEVSEKWLIS